MVSHFDWYEATLVNLYPSKLPEFVELVIDEYCKRCDLDKNDFSVARENGFNHYRDCMTIYDLKRISIARFLYNEDSPVHVISSGKRSPVLSDIIRQYQPSHYITRVDSALDFVGGSDDFRAVCNQIEACRDEVKNGRKMSITTIHQERGGDTLYLGSLKSSSFLRVYDKAQEQKQLLPRHLHGEIPEFWTRAEVVARPSDKNLRYFLAAATPDSVWNFNPVCSEFIKLLENPEAELLPTSGAGKGTPDVNKAWWTMLYQYRKTLIDRAEGMCRGDWAKFGEKIKDDLENAGFL